MRPVFLTFGGEVAPGEPFAHMVANKVLNAALRRQAAALGIDIIEGVGVQAFERGHASMRVHLADGVVFDTRLLVAADGVNSKLRALAGIKTVDFDYGQSGIVCTVATSVRMAVAPRSTSCRPARSQSCRSPATGPRSYGRSAARMPSGWSPPTSSIFETELEQRFGLQLGELKLEGKPRAWPLGLKLARAFVAPRFALAGDAAHGIHPIAGQGLNLGFKDVAALAETVVEADRLGQDIGALDVLERYERWRRFDTVQMGLTTDLLNRLFSNDLAPLRAARDFGLGLVDRIPRLKRFFIEQAAGLSGPTPRLLRGEAI